MQSLELLRKRIREAQEQHEPLIKQQEILQRQHGIFLINLESAQIIGDKEGLQKAKKALDYIESKLNEVTLQLNELNDLEPLAKAVFVQGEYELNNMARQLQEKFDNVLGLRERYIESIKELGYLRQKSLQIKAATAEAGPFIRRNPLEALMIRGFHRFEVSMDLLRSLVG